MNPSPVISIKNLGLQAGERSLLEGAELEIRDGELVLLVGASGTGKSLTLALLAGLLRKRSAIRIEGEVTVLGQNPLAESLAGRAGIQGTGVVFQDFALLDDENALGNVRFGWDHRSQAPVDQEESSASPDDDRSSAALLEEFGLPKDLYPAAMSGGMKQRLALARALAFGPRLLFYDEPTSGLDPALAASVAERIRDAHNHHGMTSVVVTHDLASLRTIADRIILLDPNALKFREVAQNEVDDALAALRGFRPPEEPKREATGSQWTKRLHAGLESAGDFVIASANTLRALIPTYPSPRWGARFFWRFLRLGTLGSALPFLALAGFIAGFITTYFLFTLLPMQGFTEPVLSEEFVGSLGYALFRVIVPGTVTLLFAARTGAAIAADIGNRVLTKQVDAFRSQGIAPERYLLSAVVLSCLIGIPLLFVIAHMAAHLAAIGVFLASHPGFGAYSFDAHFGSLLGSWGPFPGGTPWVLAKLLISALGVAGIAYHVGIREKASGSEVAAGVTEAIIRTTLFVLVVHMVFAFFEF